MTDTFFGPQSKSEEYWHRERTSEGRAMNDHLDHQEQASGLHQLQASGKATAIARGLHADLWQADAENKASWREHLQKTGELLTPEHLHRLGEGAVVRQSGSSSSLPSPTSMAPTP